jgi:hypothetical protein
MQYVGTILWGCIGAAVLAGATVFLWRIQLQRRGLFLANAWAATAFVFAGAYFTWNLWPF